MKLFRPIISVLLLLTYLISFVHSLTAHHHIDDEHSSIGLNNDEPHHHFQFHKHAAKEDIDHDDIKHESHLDDSLFDYLICLLSEIGHDEPNETHQHLVPIGVANRIEKGRANTQLAAILLTIFVAPDTNHQTISINDRPVIPDYQSPHLSSFSNKGPPVIFC